MITRRNLIIPMATPTPVAVGLWVTNAGALQTSTTARPYGVVERSDDPEGYSTVVLPGYDGVIQLKLNASAGTVVAGTLLKLDANGTVEADTGTGARVVVAEAMEAGANGQLINCRLLSTPLVYAS